MAYISTGVFDANGYRIKTKKALKELAAASPDSLGFDVTDLFGAYAGQTVDTENFPTHAVLVVHGPDPYRSRKWVANVTYNPDGTLKVT